MLRVILTNGPTGAQVADLTARITACTISTGEHGYEACSATCRMPQDEVYRFLQWTGALWLRVSDATAGVIWEGRVEIITPTDEGLTIDAVGGAQALADQPYTALWSDDTLDRWRVLKDTDISGIVDKRYSFDADDRLYIAPNNGATLGNTTTTKSGVWGYEPPDDGTRQIVALSFSWEFVGLTNWIAQYGTRDSTWSGGSTTTIANGNAGASVQTGTVSATFTACDRLLILMRFNAANAVYGQETGTYYLKLTNIRIKTTTASSVTADLIVSDMLTLAPALSTSTALITPTAFDLNNEVPEDEYPLDVIDRLAVLGDGTNRYEAGVYDRRMVYFRPRSSAARTWYVDAASLDFSRNASDVWNSVYAIYTQPAGRTLRTTASTDSDSVARYGLTRTLPITTDGTSATQAQSHRAAALADSKNPPPSGSLTLTRVYNKQGGSYPLWLVRAGDTLVIRNLPPSAPGSTIDKIRSFRIGHSSYDAMTNTLEVEPDQPPSRVELRDARRAARPSWTKTGQFRK